jgi:hypothetical protein
LPAIAKTELLILFGKEATPGKPGVQYQLIAAFALMALDEGDLKRNVLSHYRQGGSVIVTNVTERPPSMLQLQP